MTWQETKRSTLILTHIAHFSFIFGPFSQKMTFFENMCNMKPFDNSSEKLYKMATNLNKNYI
jgi:hypothetical protein